MQTSRLPLSPDAANENACREKSTPAFSTLAVLLLILVQPPQLFAAGPEPVNLRSTASFAILSGAGITTTGGGIINGDIGASPIAGSAIGVPCAQVNGTIYAVDASGPPCAVIAAGLLTTAKGDLTTAYNDAAGRTPIPTGPNLNPGLIPGSGNIGGMVLAPGLYKFTTTAMITGSDVTLNGGPDDVWIFQCAQDLQLGSGISVILAGGAQAKNIFWQVGTSAVLGTSSSFKGTILADQAITMETSSTMEGRALASTAGVVFNGSGAGSPAAPQIGVQQPPGTNLVAGASTNDFGSVPIGSNTNLTFTITNTGTADLTGLAITIDGADSAMFTVVTNPAPAVVPNGSTTFTVRFSPLSSGLKTAELHLANNTEANPFDISLTGTGTTTNVGPQIAVEQPPGTNLIDGVSSTDFGTVALGNNTNLTFTITNSGTADLVVLGFSIDGADSALFELTAIPFAPITPNGSATFTIRFTPDTAGLKTAVLHIQNNDSDENPFDITITGTGSGTVVATPEIAVQQPAGTDLVDGVGSSDFGAVAVGANNSLTFTITNSGTANLTGLGITIDGADAAQFTVTADPIAPVAPNGSTAFTVQFTPASAGLMTATLHIASNDGDENPFDITLAGTGTTTNVEPEIAVEQPLGTDIGDGVGSRDFGSVLVGTNASLTFTIRNVGGANLTGLGITIDGADAAQFAVSANPTAPVAPGGSTTFTVRYTPTSAGVKTAVLHIASNDGDENPFDITLTGTGTAVALPEIAVEQPLGTDIIDGVGSRDFGSVLVGTNTSLTFTIRNVGGANLTGLGITIDGADAAQFAVSANPTTPVAPGGSTTFTVRYTPINTGVKTAVLHIASNDADENSFDITLTGTGSDGGFSATTNVTITVTSAITLNPQTGLFEQTVRLTNTGTNAIDGLRLLILTLPADVQVYNASGSTNGTPFVQYDLPLAASASVDLLIEYYRANRQPIPEPVYVVEIAPPVVVTATGPFLAIDGEQQLSSGRFLIEFTATPGARYAVQYSSDGENWKTANPIITAPANRVQWCDDGPPKTGSKPSTSGSRFYRVMALP